MSIASPKPAKSSYIFGTKQSGNLGDKVLPRSPSRLSVAPKAKVEVRRPERREAALWAMWLFVWLMIGIALIWWTFVTTM